MDAFQSEDNGDTIASTLLLIKVLFEDLQLGFEIHQQFKENTPKDVDVKGTKFFLLNQIINGINILLINIQEYADKYSYIAEVMNLKWQE